MTCLFRDCQFDMDGDINSMSAVEEQHQMMAFHVKAEHTPSPVPAPAVQPTAQRKKPERFPRPTVVVDETREHLDNLQLRWTQYRDEINLQGADIGRQWVACCSDDLSISLNRLTGGRQALRDGGERTAPAHE